MDGIDAALLGIVQGLTEFLPVSSSGHLEIGKALLGDHSVPEESLLFTVVVHFATALSTIIVFRKDILILLKGIFKFRWNEELQFALKIGLSMIPAILIGLAFEKEMEQLFTENMSMVGMMLIITSLLLIFADRAKKSKRNVSFLDAFIIGVAQAIAILPGISRSGATISTSVLLRNNKSSAARFSFLMVVPLIIGKIAKDLLSGDLNDQNTHISILGIGFITAFIAGIFACTWMIKLVKNSKLSYFAIYCAIVGIIAISSTLFE